MINFSNKLIHWNIVNLVKWHGLIVRIQRRNTENLEYLIFSFLFLKCNILIKLQKIVSHKLFDENSSNNIWLLLCFTGSRETGTITHQANCRTYFKVLNSEMEIWHGNGIPLSRKSFWPTLVSKIIFKSEKQWWVELKFHILITQLMFMQHINFYCKINTNNYVYIIINSLNKIIYFSKFINLVISFNL